jgi:hypothetical protein
MIGFLGIGGLCLFCNTLWRFIKNHDPLILTFVKIWMVLVVVIIVYFIALESNFAAALWARGIWFNEDDVLHIMMVIWVLIIYWQLRTRLKDKTPENQARP